VRLKRLPACKAGVQLVEKLDLVAIGKLVTQENFAAIADAWKIDQAASEILDHDPLSRQRMKQLGSRPAPLIRAELRVRLRIYLCTG
jgi:hypothetical protein